MTVLVKRGGREEYLCSTCEKPIPIKEPHYRGGGKPFKRYHEGCLPAKGGDNPAVAEVT